MKINVKSIPDEGLSLDECEDPSELGLTDQDAVIVGTVRSIVHITKMRNSFYVKGSSEAILQRECSRCLGEFSERLNSKFELMFQEAGSMRSHRERVLEQRDVGISFYDDDKIDLGPEIRQSIILAVPMKPLCREDCKGLCPGCGEDRNEDACTCHKEDHPARSDTDAHVESGEGKGTLGELLSSALSECLPSRAVKGGQTRTKSKRET